MASITNTPISSQAQPSFGKVSVFTDPLPLKMYTTRRFYEGRMSEAEFNDPTVRKYIDLRLLKKVKEEIQAESQQAMMRQMQEVYKDSPYASMFNPAATGAGGQGNPLMNMLQDPKALEKLQNLQGLMGGGNNNAYSNLMAQNATSNLSLNPALQSTPGFNTVAWK